MTPETLTDPDILRISHATTLIDDPELTRRSVSKRWAQVALTLKNGQRIQGVPMTPRGDVDLSVSDAEISAKFHLLADEGLGLERANELERLCAEFDTLDSAGFALLLDLCLSGTSIPQS